MRERFTKDLRLLQSHYDTGHYDTALLDMQTQLLDMSRELFSDDSVCSMNQATEIQQDWDVAAAAATGSGAAAAAASLPSSATMGH